VDHVVAAEMRRQPGRRHTCASAGTVSATNNATRSTGTGRRIAPALRAFAQQRYDLGVHGRVLGVADDDFAQAPPAVENHLRRPVFHAIRLPQSVIIVDGNGHVTPSVSRWRTTWVRSRS